MSRLRALTAAVSLSAVAACGAQESSIEIGERMPPVVADDEGAFGQPQYSQAERGAQIQVEAAPEVDTDGMVVPLTTVTAVIEIQDGSPAEFVDENIVVDTTQVPTSVPTPQTTVPEQPVQVDDAESQDAGTPTTDDPEPAVRVAATPSDAEEVAIAESYEPESVPPTTGGITRIDGPATVGEPAVRVEAQPPGENKVYANYNDPLLGERSYSLAFKNPLECVSRTVDTGPEVGVLAELVLDVTPDVDQPAPEGLKVRLDALNYWDFFPVKFLQQNDIIFGRNLTDENGEIASTFSVEALRSEYSVDIRATISMGNVVVDQQVFAYPIICE